MTKKLLSATLIAVLLLTGCSIDRLQLEQFGQIRKNTDDLYTDDFVEMLFDEDVSESESKEDSLAALFSETAKSANGDIKAEISELIEFFSNKEGEIEWRDNGGGASKSADHGKVNETVLDGYVVTMNGIDYNLVIAACSRDTENSDNIGIYSIYFNEVQLLNGKFDHSEDPAYTAWYDERPFGVSSPLFDKDDAA